MSINLECEYLPPLPLLGDVWAQTHPEEHAKEVAEAEVKLEVVMEKSRVEGFISPAEILGCRTTRERMNDVDLEFRRG